MIAPRASSAFVCLRCELRIARPKVSSIASFSSSARPRDVPRVQDGRAPSATSEPNSKKLSEYPLGKLRRRKGKTALRAHTAQLAGLKTLGNESEILVLKEVGVGQEEGKGDEPKVKKEKPNGVPQSSGIFSVLEGEKADLEPKEINQHLDSFRPNPNSEPGEPQYISSAEFRKLSKSLVESFTAQQLSQYLSNAQSAGQPAAKQTVSVDVGQKRQVQRTQWYPGTTPLKQRLDKTATPQDPKRPPPKKLLVDQILRNVWNTVLLEEIESPGTIEMTLAPWQINLLSAGPTSGPLDRIGRLRRAKIEVSKPFILRITAAKSNAEYAADDIEQLLKSTHAHTFLLEPWVRLLDEDQVPKNLSKIFTRDSLHAVGDLTGAHVKPLSDNAILIRALDEASVQDAHRCLINLLPLKPSHERAIERQILDMGKQKYYFVPTAFQNTLPYSYRSMGLGRWVSPASKHTSEPLSEMEQHGSGTPQQISTTAVPDSSAEELQNKILTAAETRLHRVLPSSNTPVELSSGAMWSADPKPAFVAQFGQSLSRMSDNSPTVPKSGSHDSQGLFVTSVPGIPKIFLNTALEPAQARHTFRYLVYKFVPAPVQEFKLESGQRFPGLYLRIKLVGRTATLSSVGLNFNKYHHEVLLPHEATDIRFKQYQTLSLMEPQKDPNISAFSEAVCANIQSGNRLTAPSSLTVEVPRWTLPGYKRDDTGTESIKYLFTNIQHRQLSHVADFGDYPVRYRTSEEGRLGGKGGDISLFYAPRAEKMDELETFVQTDRLKTFVKASFSFARLLTQVASDPSPLSGGLKTRPRDQLSARKLARKSLTLDAGRRHSPEGGHGSVSVSEEDQGFKHFVDGDALPGISQEPDAADANGVDGQTVDAHVESESSSSLQLDRADFDSHLFSPDVLEDERVMGQAASTDVTDSVEGQGSVERDEHGRRTLSDSA